MAQTTNFVELLREIVTILALNIDEGVLAGAVNQALRSCDEQDWSEVLKHACNEIGITTYPYHGILQELLPFFKSNTPWVTLSLSSEGSATFYIVKNKHRKKLNITQIDASRGTTENSQILIKEFQKKLLGESLEKPTLWVTAEAAAPLEIKYKTSQLNQEEDSHDHPIDPISRIKILLRNDKNDMLTVIIYSLFIGILSLATPVAVQLMINTFAFGNVFQLIVILAIFVFVALLFSSILTALRKFTLEIMQQRIFARVSTDTTYRLLQSRFEAFDRINGPELLNRFFDVTTVQKGVASLFLEGLSVFAQTLVGTVLLAFYHPYFLAFDVFLLAAFSFTLFALGRGAIKTAIQESEAKYAVAAWLQEIAGKLTTFKFKQASNYARQHSDSLVRHYIEKRNKHFKIHFAQIIASLVIYVLSLTALLVVGGWLLIKSELSIGQLVAAEFILTNIVVSFFKFNKHLEYYYDLVVGMEKIGHITDLPLEKLGGESLEKNSTPARISIKNLSFHSYSDQIIFEQVNMEIPAGSCTGLTGSVGSEKTLIADFIYGLRIPQTGVIEIDGIDYRSLNLGDLREQIFLARGNEIFHDTIIENLRFGAPDVTIQDVKETLEKVDLLKDVQGLPEGVNTVLKSGGNPFRINQIARLLIARAMLAKPRVIIIDELLDLIDETEYPAVYETLFRSNLWTLLIISKNQNVLSYCDNVFNLDHGRINKFEVQNL